jgi:hypothetical protein
MKKAAKKHTTGAFRPEVGKVAQICAGRFRGHVVVTRARYVSKGRRAGLMEYELASLEPDGFGRKAFAVTVWEGKGHTMLSAPTKQFAAKVVEAAMGGVHTKHEEIAERKQERADAGREVLGKADWNSRTRSGIQATDKIAVGDVVQVQYSNRYGTTDEVVAAINLATGKVGIERSAGQHDPFSTTLSSLLGGRRGRTHREVRWLPATMIKGIKTPVKALPCALSDERKAEIQSKGWFHLRFSNGEFITSSYLVATSREKAREMVKGRMYDSPDERCYHDEALGVYWIATGCFD